MLIFGETHLRQVLTLYACYYNELRAAGSRGPTIRKHCRYARPVGAASSLRADMISGRDRLSNSRAQGQRPGMLHRDGPTPS